uniref:C-type lectin domain-containing protein n=1 Tax=Neolamprologus brichardi TaxID=32507 RepID=A0A3Q4MZL4_NEOBR
NLHQVKILTLNMQNQKEGQRSQQRKLPCWFSVSYWLLSFSFFHLNEILCSNIFKDEPCSKCGEDWEHHGGKCYYFSTRKSSWTESRGECRSKGGDLVKIDSREEQKFLDQRLKDIMNYPQDKFWFGLTDSAEEGRWLWVDGSILHSSLEIAPLKEEEYCTVKKKILYS